MKKVKLLLMMVLVITTIVCTGCGAKSNVSMTEEGKGTQEVKISINKLIYSQEYSKVSNINDIANIIKSKINNDAISITTDTSSNASEDYIVASFKYDSVKDMDNVIKQIEADMETLGTPDIDIFGEDNEDELSDEEIEQIYTSIIKEYLTANKIEFDANSTGFTKFIAALEKAMDESEDIDLESDDEEYDLDEEEFDFDNEEFDLSDFMDEDLDEEEFLTTNIIKGANSSVLRIGAANINILPMYIYAIVGASFDSIYDMNAMVNGMTNSSVEDIIAEEKDTCFEVFNKINLATSIKNVLSANATENNAGVFNINNLTDEQINKIFTKEMNNAIAKAYNDAHEASDEDFSDLDLVNVDMDEVFEQVSNAYVNNITYGKQTVSVTLKNIDSITDDEGYISIDSEKGLVKPVGTKKTVDMDETPATADNFQLMFVAGIAVLAALLGAVVYIRRRVY